MVIQVWLNFILKMNELFDKQVNAQKEGLKKTSGVHASPQKVCDKNESRIIKKQGAHTNVFDGRKKTCAMDINQLQVDDC